MTDGFIHAVKVPRLYKTASKIIKEVRRNGGSLKTLIFQQNHPNTSAIYSLCFNALKREAQLDHLLKATGIINQETRLDPWLAKILITELLWGKKVLKSEAKPVKTILKYENQLRENLKDISTIKELAPVPVTVYKPRYVRINTILLPVGKAISAFSKDGWTLLRPCSNYTEHLKQVKQLREPNFMRDFHVPELFIFPSNVTFYNHPAYINGELILQDKASCFPAHLLNPRPGSTVIDMCAAPGMKTTQLAALMKNIGKIYAVEIDAVRHKTLCKQVELAGARCVQALHMDALNLESDKYSNVEYILVDPSCSGTGMVERQIISNHQKCSQERLKQLHAFQVFLLRHALLNFPKVKRVVYSTCSLRLEENEKVIDEILENVGDAYRLVSIKDNLQDKWNNYSSKDFACSDHCLYSHPELDLCNGFFVAVFERNFNIPLPEYKSKGSKSHQNKISIENNGVQNETENPDAGAEKQSRKRKKRGKKKASSDAKKDSAISLNDSAVTSSKTKDNEQKGKNVGKNNEKIVTESEDDESGEEKVEAENGSSKSDEDNEIEIEEEYLSNENGEDSEIEIEEENLRNENDEEKEIEIEEQDDDDDSNEANEDNENDEEDDEEETPAPKKRKVGRRKSINGSQKTAPLINISSDSIEIVDEVESDEDENEDDEITEIKRVEKPVLKKKIKSKVNIKRKKKTEVGSLLKKKKTKIQKKKKKKVLG